VTGELRGYIYRGDRLTDPALRGKKCLAVLRPDGKCITGRSAMLVYFIHEPMDVHRVVQRRQLRRIV
jgi:hypothetical protein